MSSTTFVLKEPQTKIPVIEQKESLIYMFFHYGNKRLKVSTNKKIIPKYWNTKSHRAKLVRGNGEYARLNARLNQFESSIKDIYDNFILTGTSPTNDRLKKELAKRLQLNSGDSTKITLNEYIDNYINEVKNGERLTDKKTKYKYNTIRSFDGFKNQFKEYQEMRRRNLDFNDITIDFYDDFVNYFTQKGNTQNTIGRLIKILKSIMRVARDEGLHKNTEIDRKKFKTLRVESDQIYLTEREIDKLYKLDLSDNKTLEIARDVFLIGYYTVQRFSDFSKIKHDNIKTLNSGIEVIELKQSKTGEKVTIPIHFRLKEILKKYENSTPKIYEQKLNERIKTIGALAKINDPTLTEGVKGGIRFSKKIPKCYLISTHTARRSGATNMYLAGISSIDIMKITGHKTEREFLKYIKVTKEETANILAGHSYFNKVQTG